MVQELKPARNPQTLAELAARVATQWEQVGSTFTKKLNTATLTVAKSFEGLPNKSERDLLTRTHVARVTTEMLREVQGDRAHNVRRQELRSLAAEVAAATARHEDPLWALDTYTLTSPRRSQLAATVAQAGPAALLSAAQTAVDTGDHELAAAVAQRVGAMRPKDRPVVAKDLASKVLPPAAKAAREVLRAASAAMARAEKASWATNPPSGTDKISFALRHPAAPLEREEAE